jgi:hypothetical protein
MSSTSPPRTSPHDNPETPPDFETLIRRFEDLWQEGQRPAIEDFLCHDGAERQRVLVELAHVELELRLKAGEPARIEEYLRRFPELARERAIEWELLVAEYTQRARREPDLSSEEYVRRFPHCRRALQPLYPHLQRDVAPGDLPEVVTHLRHSPPLIRGNATLVAPFACWRAPRLLEGTAVA